MVIEAGHAARVFGHERWLEAAKAAAGNIEPDLAATGQYRLLSAAVAVITKMVAQFRTCMPDTLHCLSTGTAASALLRQEQVDGEPG